MAPIFFLLFFLFHNLEAHINPYGFIEVNTIADVRQVFNFREAHFALWPKEKLFDKCCNDINANGEFLITAIPSRVGAFIDPIEIADQIFVEGQIEGDFIGTNDFNTNTFRMRLGYINLNFEKIDSSLVIGLSWNPITPPDCYPHTLAYTFGTPINELSRNPQIRYTQNIGNFQFIFTAMSQRDFKSAGPIGLDTSYLRNAIIPNLNFEIRYDNDNFFVGGCIDYKRIVPRLVTNKDYKAYEHVDSFIAVAFAKVFNENGYFLTKCSYCQNATDQVGISGYAVETQDPVTNRRKYTPTSSIAAWFDAALYFGQDQFLEVGLLAGGVKNLGSNKRLFINPDTNKPIIFDIDNRIDTVIRVSPRVFFTYKEFSWGLEFEVTRAGFGEPNAFARKINPVPVTNLRIIGATFYAF